MGVLQSNSDASRGWEGSDPRISGSDKACVHNVAMSNFITSLLPGYFKRDRAQHKRALNLYISNCKI